MTPGADLASRRAYLASLKCAVMGNLLGEHHACGVFRARTMADCEYTAHQRIARLDRDTWEIRQKARTVDASRLVAHWRRRAQGIRDGQSIETEECAAVAIDGCATVIETMSETMTARADVRRAIQDALMESGLLQVSGAQTTTVERCVRECIEEIELALFSLWQSQKAHFASLRDC